MDDRGDVLCGLDELLLIAAERWRAPLTQHGLARVCGLSRSTIQALAPRHDARAATAAPAGQGRIALRTIAALCSVFMCMPGELLRYRAAGKALPRLSPSAVRRADAPSGAVRVYPLTNTIPDRLQPYTPTVLARATGIGWSTWKRAKGGTSQLDLSTLAAICTLLNTDVSSLLVPTIPFRPATWSIRFVRWDDQRLFIDLSHDVTVSAYLVRWKALAQASAAARDRWHLTDDQQGIRWDDLNVEIFPRLLLD